MTVTYRDTPGRTWVDLETNDYAAGEALPAQFWAAVVNNLELLHRFYCGETCTATTYPHSHRGAEDAHLADAMPPSNILLDSAPNARFKHVWYWDKKVTSATTDGLLFTGVEGATAFQFIPPMNDRPDDLDDFEHAYFLICRSIYGGDGRVTVSAFAKLAGATPTRGQLSFGICDGGTDYAEGCEAIIDYSDLSTSWKRFYAFMTVKDVQDGARFQLAQTLASDAATYTTAFMVSPGWRLGYWQPCRLDKASPGEEHESWSGYALNSCPVFEQATAITNAVRLYPV